MKNKASYDWNCEMKLKTERPHRPTGEVKGLLKNLGSHWLQKILNMMISVTSWVSLLLLLITKHLATMCSISPTQLFLWLKLRLGTLMSYPLRYFKLNVLKYRAPRAEKAQLSKYVESGLYIDLMLLYLWPINKAASTCLNLVSSRLMDGPPLVVNGYQIDKRHISFYLNNYQMPENVIPAT